MTATNIALKVPFSEKDQAKALGAKWNAEAKHWYVPQGVNAEPFAQWITAGAAPASTPAPAVKPTAKPAGKQAPTAKSAPISNDAIEDDLDAINARLRDAFEARDFD